MTATITITGELEDLAPVLEAIAKTQQPKVVLKFGPVSEQKEK